MYIIDSQVHIWEPDRPERPWDRAAAQPRHQDAMTIERVISMMDTVGVDANLLVSTKLYGYDNSYVLDSIAKYPDRLAGVGRLDPDAPDPDAVMKGWRSQPGMLSFRLMAMNDAETDALRRADPLLAAAARHRVPVCLYPPAAIEQVGEMARKHPDLQIVVDHLALKQPAAGSPDPLDELPRVLKLAAHPNIAIKLSAVPLQSKEAFPFLDLWPAIHGVLNAFGRERVIWGADATQVARDHTYEQALAYLRDSHELSESDKLMLFAGALRTVFRWDPHGRHAAAAGPHHQPTGLIANH